MCICVTLIMDVRGIFCIAGGSLRVNISVEKHATLCILTEKKSLLAWVCIYIDEIGIMHFTKI